METIVCEPEAMVEDLLGQISRLEAIARNIEEGRIRCVDPEAALDNLSFQVVHLWTVMARRYPIL